MVLTHTQVSFPCGSVAVAECTPRPLPGVWPRGRGSVEEAEKPHSPSPSQRPIKPRFAERERRGPVGLGPEAPGAATPSSAHRRHSLRDSGSVTCPGGPGQQVNLPKT